MFSSHLSWSKVVLFFDQHSFFFFLLLLLLLFNVLLFATPWTTACQAPLSSTISPSLLKFMCIEAVMLSNHLILCRHLLLLPSVFPSISVFSNGQLFPSDGQRTEASVSASILPMNIQGSFPLGLTGLISSQFKGFSRVFSSTRVQTHRFFGAQLYVPNLAPINDS